MVSSGFTVHQANVSKKTLQHTDTGNVGLELIASQGTTKFNPQKIALARIKEMSLTVAQWILSIGRRTSAR